MQLSDILRKLVTQNLVLPEAADNLVHIWDLNPDGSVPRAAIEELLRDGHHKEINDRFFKKLAFGTGGIRGRTIGRHVTAAEQGRGGPLGRPQFACVGTNAMNEANIERATRGLCRYLRKSFPAVVPTVVFAHDTRHFSRDFAELAARVALNEGCHAALFTAERSTPQLSFTVRHLGAHAGVVITASHNPPHDNGFKAYFADGGQLVEPHASGVIEEVNAAKCSADLAPANGATLRTLASELDDVYLLALETLVLDRLNLVSQGPQLKIVFTPIHGTGARAVPAILRRFGVQPHMVPSQSKPDGRFPTVKSPNPENAEALALGIAEAQRIGADLVIGTDPDADRMGIAVRDKDGQFICITGNQIASLLAHYRVTTLFAKGVLSAANAPKACLIKTFVTTDLLTSIAEHYGLKIVNTLTGFKYIGKKMLRYEEDFMAVAGGSVPYHQRKFTDVRHGQLQNGCYFVFGGEESYGYSGGDYVRDKDANASVLMLAEVAAAVRSHGRSLLDYLDDIYRTHGYYLERLGQIELEGADGAARSARMLASFDTNPPEVLAGQNVVRVDNFTRDDFSDVDGDPIPKELMFMFHLANGTRVTVRGSGTEPKVKFYLSAFHRPHKGVHMNDTELLVAKTSLAQQLDALWDEVRADALQRAG